MTGTANIRLDEKLWIEMIERTLNKQVKYIDTLNFYVDLKEMYDKQGNLYYQEFPVLAINFK